MPKKPVGHIRESIALARAEAEAARGSSRDRGYTRRWDIYSAKRRQEYPICVMCKAKGTISPAEVTDHIKPASVCSDAEFWDPENHQSLCFACNAKKAKQDRAKYGSPNKMRGRYSRGGGGV